MRAWILVLSLHHTLRLGVYLPPHIPSSASTPLPHPLSRPQIVSQILSLSMSRSLKSWHARIVNGGSSQALTPDSPDVWLTLQGDIPAMYFHFRH
ncbi:hypothetical protein DFH09DRAFT_1165109, partial [Mycena vulgaris]